MAPETARQERKPAAGDLEWGGRMDDDLLDAVGWAVATGIADPERIAIMGVSLAVTPSSPA